MFIFAQKLREMILSTRLKPPVTMLPLAKFFKSSPNRCVSNHQDPVAAGEQLKVPKND